MKSHQKKLLKLLAINSRFSNKDLAKVLHVSEDTINYTKAKFLQDKVFTYNVFFDYRKLGYKIYHLLFSLSDIENVDMQKLKKIKDISYINTFIGKYDIHIIALIKNNLRKKTKEILRVLGKNIIKRTILKYDSELKLTHILPDFNIETPVPKNQKKFSYILKTPEVSVESEVSNYVLDNKDLKIINSLMKDPTKNYLQIQKETKISRETIKSRIKKYIIDKFLLSFSIYPNVKYFQYNTYCLLLNIEKIDIEKIKEFVLQKDYIFYAEKTTGEKNLFLYIWSKDPSDFSSKFKEIKKHFKESISGADLLFYDEYLYQKEFPTSLLAI